MVAPDAPETLCSNNPRPMKCGSRSASSSVATMVTQQSALASTGLHSSALRPATIAATADLVAAGSRRSSTNSAARPIAAVNVVPELLLQRPASHQLAVPGRIELIARRAAGQPRAARARKCAGDVARPRCAWPANVNIASDMAMSIVAAFAGCGRAAAAPSRMFITAGSVPPPMSAISAGGTFGRSSGPGLQRQQPGVADVVDVVTRLRGARAGLAVAGDRAIDQPRIDLAQRLGAETEPRHHAGPELLDQDVGALDQRHQPGAVALVLEIEHQALLAAIEHARTSRSRRRSAARSGACPRRPAARS